MDDYCCYDILENDIYGRYAIASKDLEPGDLITSELPFMYGPKSDSSPVCLGCHCGVDGSTVCSTCKWPVCNEACEKQPIHSENECGIFSKVGIKFTPVKDLSQSCPQYECIMPLRMLLKKEREEEVWKNEIETLESHCEKRRNTEIWRVEAINVVGFLHKVCKLKERFPEELIHFVCGILEVNAFIAPVAYGYEMRCLYPKTSLLTHSCVPNVGHYIFSKHRIYVRAMVKIKKGEELLLTYTQTLSPTLFRRAHLREGKYFDCACERCADPTELGTNLSTLKCRKCNKGWVLSSNPLDETKPWKCTVCEFNTTTENVLNLLQQIQIEADELRYIKNGDVIARRENFIKKYESVLHPNHAIILSVKSSLSQLYGKTDGYLLKNLPDELLERKIELCNEIDRISHKIKPGISRQRAAFYSTEELRCNLERFGWNLYELYAPLILLIKKQPQQNETDKICLKIKFQEAMKCLEEVIFIFSYEDPESPEGITGKMAFQTLKDLKTSIENIFN